MTSIPDSGPPTDWRERLARLPAIQAASVPSLSAAEMAAVDRRMIDDLGIGGELLMETAGRAVAEVARRMLPGGDAAGRRIVIACGSGNNGGDGLVAARHLTAWGAAVSVWLTRPADQLRTLPRQHLASLDRLGVPYTIVVPETDPPALDADLVIDALLGFGTERPPSDAGATLIATINHATAPVLAVDNPSGLNVTSGEVYDPCVRAAATVTLALPKRGLLVPAARAVTGTLLLADIGVPSAVLAAAGHPTGPIFRTSSLFRLTP